MTAILRVTDGTVIVDLLNGPFYLANWRPAVAQYKGDGVFLDSPLSSGRILAYRTFQNATERFDLKMRASSADQAAYHISQLFFLIEKAAEHHISLGEIGPVWVEKKAHRETELTYAVMAKMSFPSLENPFSQPFLQSDCHAVMDNLVLIAERFDWQGSLPGYLSPINVIEVVPEHDIIRDPSFERGLGNVYADVWTDYNTPTTIEVRKTRAYDGINSLYIDGSLGTYEGTYLDVASISGAIKTITVKCYVESGAGALIVYDGGGFSNAVVDITGSRQQEVLSNGEFETNLNGWTASPGSIARVAGGYDSTSWAMETTPSAADRFSVKSDFETNPAGTSAITISFAVKRTSAGEGDDTLVYATARWKNLSGNIFSTISAYGQPPTLIPYVLIDTPVQDQWYYHTITVEPPSIEVYGHLYNDPEAHDWSYETYSGVNLTAFETSATYEFDAVSIKAGAPAINEYGEWQTLSVTKTVPGGGTIRIALATDTTLGGKVYFDDVKYKREYVPGGTTYDAAFVSGVGLEYNLTEVYIDNNGVFSANLLESTLPYELLPTVPVATEDAIYFGSGIGPFASLAFDLSSVIDADSVGFVWKYYNGSSWATLDARDPTNELQNGGRNVVSWYVPEDWEKTTVNSINNYWVMADLTGLTGVRTIPVQSTSHVHTVNKPFFEISADDLSGDLPSAIKYRITNESGPTRGSAFLSVAAGADDVTTDDALSSLASAGASWRLEEDTSVGIRFQNVPIPPGATITKAFLWYAADSSSDSDPDGTYLVYTINGEDADDSAAFSTWANFDGRSRTSATGYMYSATGSFPTSPAGMPNASGWWPEINNIVQEIIDRPNWTADNSMTFFLTDHTIGASDWIQGDMYETDTDAWRLELEWTPSARYTSSVFLGSRKKSRGEDFRGYINFSQDQPAGITVQPGQLTSRINIPGKQGALIPYASALMTYADPNIFGGGVPGFPQGGGWYGGFTDAVIIKITKPLAASYKGKYRVFTRVIRDYISVFGNADLRLRASVGSGGSVYTNTVSTADSSEPMLIDLGQLTVPQTTSSDVIELAIQIRASQGLPIVYFLDMILLPIDEWFIEAEVPSGSTVALDADSYMELDSATVKTYGTVASIRDKLSGDVRSNMIVSGIPSILDPNETHRIWLVTMTDRSDSSILGVDATPRASYSDITHSIKVEALSKYLGMRGDS